ncbi:MAG: 16S rRNA (cytosine(1402)-N(4))-methyltransferase RsmH [Clostridia bacterium]|nr:16S rRNA (cytosine(1402)-N(4))-methyltransferase RsmH [Clostridia bacterium]MEE1054458.1 16S rRNA (cytosine(1402)-N(4))-methyltransferase RsmH [Acutalibacteraceae bacterium]
MEFNHKSVLLNEAVDALAVKPDGIYIDGTAGGAGHSSEIAKRLDTGMLYALDRDPDAVKIATERLKTLRAQVIQSNFSEMDTVMKNLGIEGVDGILLDLGVSSYQLDTADRGFSYHKDAPLDMRMSKSGITAGDIVNNSSEDELKNIFWRYGEEKFSGRIAARLVKERQDKRIETTLQLAEIISSAVPAAARRDGHPARKCFQALRIAVNGELDALESALDRAFGLLNKDGVLAIITFHSLEDRMVKQKFKEYTTGCTCPPDFPVCVCGKTPKGRLLTRKPIEPSRDELEYNPRSRSAKLRVIIKN